MQIWKQKLLKHWDFHGTLQLPEPCRIPTVCSGVVCQGIVWLFPWARSFGNVLLHQEQLQVSAPPGFWGVKRRFYL